MNTATRTSMNVTLQEPGGLINNKLTYSLTFSDARHLTVHLIAIWAYNPPGKKEKIQFGTEWLHSAIDNGPTVKLKNRIINKLGGN